LEINWKIGIKVSFSDSTALLWQCGSEPLE
jgi:hypothetical protein